MKDYSRIFPNSTEDQSRVLEVFQAYSEVIVNILEDSSFEEYETLLLNIDADIPFDPDIWEFLKRHQKAFATLSRRYLEIQELGGDVSKAMLQNNQYVKYINGLRKRKIGIVTDKNELDPLDRSYWERQTIFKTILTTMRYSV